MDDNDGHLTEYGLFSPTREILLQTGIASLEETQQRLAELLRVLKLDPDDVDYINALCLEIAYKGDVGWGVLTTYYLSRECVGNA